MSLTKVHQAGRLKKMEGIHLGGGMAVAYWNHNQYGYYKPLPLCYQANRSPDYRSYLPFLSILLCRFALPKRINWSERIGK